MDKVLIVEDTDTLRDVLVSLLEDKGYSVDAFESAEEALEAIKHNIYTCILSDFKLPGKNGIELLKETREISKTVPFVIMTAFGSIDISVEAMKLGANDFLTKPFEPDTLCTVIQDVIKYRRIIDRSSGIKTRRERRFLTENPRTQKLLYQAKKVAQVNTSVLILGESGTGKELIARYIHEHSQRSDKPFIAINCAALPEDLLESELFGHEAGAYTGATQKRIGVFEYATEGTIFLDEIGDMPQQLQVKLLRALQENEIKRVGSNKTIRVNPRIISATNHNIEVALNNGTIRDDFYYRVAVVTLTPPPLRERPEDIDLLIGHYIDYFCNATGKQKLSLGKEAKDLIKKYRWPGNTRELENVMERAVILAESVIAPEHLGIRLDLDFDAREETSTTLQEISAQAAKKAEMAAISRILNQTMGNKAEAARILGVSYKTLLNKVKDYEIKFSSTSAPS